LSLSYCSWIYNYLCNQCLSPLTLWVRTPLRRGELDTTLCDKVCQWRGVQLYVIKIVSALRQVGGFLRVLQFPSPIKLTATKILLKVALNTTKQTINVVHISLNKSQRCNNNLSLQFFRWHFGKLCREITDLKKN
jgi:hypothetical protein